MTRIKKVTTCSIALSILFTATGVFAKGAYSDFSPSEERRLVRLCEAVKSDSRMKLNALLRKEHLSFREINNQLVCNGMDAITFAVKNGAHNTANLIASRANVSIDNYAKTDL